MIVNSRVVSPGCIVGAGDGDGRGVAAGAEVARGVATAGLHAVELISRIIGRTIRRLFLIFFISFTLFIFRYQIKLVSCVIGTDDLYSAGLIFWFMWKKFCGSYLALICVRRV